MVLSPFNLNVHVLLQEIFSCYFLIIMSFHPILIFFLFETHYLDNIFARLIIFKNLFTYFPSCILLTLFSERFYCLPFLINIVFFLNLSNNF